MKSQKSLPLLRRSLTFDARTLILSVGKGLSHAAVGKWEQLGGDAVEALGSIGLKTTPEELAYTLIRRSLVKATFSLLNDNLSAVLSDISADAEENVRKLEISSLECEVDREFLAHPERIRLVKDMANQLAGWLAYSGITIEAARNIAMRLPSYFIFALNNEWRSNAKTYKPILEATSTPFTAAAEHDWAWMEYRSLLERRIQEGVFNEAFTLSQIYIPLNAYFEQEIDSRDSPLSMASSSRRSRRVVVALEKELMQWLATPNAAGAIRVISGGPGSGKSSFARIFAAVVSRSHQIRPLFVPLHLIDPTKDLVDEIGRFVRDEGILKHNPLNPDDPDPNVLIILDGLDELSSQGKAAADIARAFVREIDRVTHRVNSSQVRLRILLSGRELVVQENQSEFRQKRQVLNILPYFTKGLRPKSKFYRDDEHEYDDPDGLLQIDLRHQWWQTYGQLTGSSYIGLPVELDRPDLFEVTSQPLLNYLVALSYTRKQVDFNKGLNLNSVYADLVSAVHERGYEKRSYGPIGSMTSADFARVLEEIGLAAWHGDGRTTTVREIEAHCRTSGLSSLLDVFREGAQAGVTRLLAAFFFRQHGQRTTGEQSFVFTHKSFGEYLAAKRVIRAVDRVSKELAARTASPDAGWDERDCLVHWVQICGPSSISSYLQQFILDEVSARKTTEAALWQRQLTALFCNMLRHGMPMEKAQIAPYSLATFQSRNAEEALLVTLNACARSTQERSKVSQPSPDAFGAWFKRVQGQRTGPESSLVSRCLSFIELHNASFDIADLYNADLSHSDLTGSTAQYACFMNADLSHAVLSKCKFFGSNFTSADFANADLTEASIDRPSTRLRPELGVSIGLSTEQLRSVQGGAVISRKVPQIKKA